MNWDGCLDPDTGIATLNCVPVVFNNVIDAALILAGTFAIAFVIVSGYKYMNSGGDPKKVAEARASLTWAIVGLVIIMLSFFIVNFIGYITGVDCINTIGFNNCATP